MKLLNLYCETVKKYRPRSKSVYSYGHNILNRNFNPTYINTAWVTGITYIYVPRQGFCYLTTVIDLASRKPVGWHFSKIMTAESALNALKTAMADQGFPKGIILHSDRGSQFTSQLYMDFAKLVGITQSFSQKGCPYDNAVIESFHSSLKKELVYRFAFLDFEHAKLCLFDYIENFYIRHRIHSALDYLTPQAMEDKLKSLAQAAA